MEFEDEAAIQGFCKQSRGKAKLVYDKSPPDIIHLASHTKGCGESALDGLDYSGIDIGAEDSEPLDFECAAAKILTWSSDTLLVFFNSCYSVNVGKAMMQKYREAGVPPPHIIAWDAEVPNALCNRLVAKFYDTESRNKLMQLKDQRSQLVQLKDQRRKFKLFFGAIATLATKTKFVVSISEPIRGDGVASTEKTYTPTLLRPDDEDDVVDATLMVDSATHLEVGKVVARGGETTLEVERVEEGRASTVEGTDEGTDVEQQIRSRYEIVDESMKCWIEFAVFGKKKHVDVAEWLRSMGLKDADSVFLVSYLKTTMRVDDMDDVGYMEKDDLNAKLSVLVEQVTMQEKSGG
jgi:hypothetical protein